MFETFKMSFCLRNTYKANGIIWSLKGIPLIGKLLPSSLYSSRGLKIFADILSGIIEFISVFAGKLIYLFFVFVLFADSYDKAAPSEVFVHILIFTTLVGGFLNTNIFEPQKHKFYAIFNMRMDARKSAITDYIYFLIKMYIGFTFSALVFGRMCGVSTACCLVFPIYVICVKLIFAFKNLVECKKMNKVKNENRFSFHIWIGVALLLAAAFLPPVFGCAFGEYVMFALTAVLLIPSVFFLRYILKFDSYRAIYKELLKPENFMSTAGTRAAGDAQRLAMQKKISVGRKQTSNKKGYKYFNELFMKRHSGILTRSARLIALAALIFLSAAAAVISFFPDAKVVVNNMLMTYLPYMLFVMYIINRGKVITQAMFMNCDHSMLTYRFYRQPKAILSLFVERLKYIVLINLIPASVISAGLPILLYITGGTDNFLNYIVLFISINAMSIFFSVHSMVLYYLLQPYNINLESKSAAYGILNWITYFVSYMAIQFELPTVYFGSAISAFCIIYAVIAFILAYRLAPRTFKLRN